MASAPDSKDLDEPVPPLPRLLRRVSHEAQHGTISAEERIWAKEQLVESSTETRHSIQRWLDVKASGVQNADQKQEPVSDAMNRKKQRAARNLAKVQDILAQAESLTYHVSNNDEFPGRQIFAVGAALLGRESLFAGPDGALISKDQMRYVLQTLNLSMTPEKYRSIQHNAWKHLDTRELRQIGLEFCAKNIPISTHSEMVAKLDAAWDHPRIIPRKVGLPALADADESASAAALDREEEVEQHGWVATRVAKAADISLLDFVAPKIEKMGKKKGKRGRKGVAADSKDDVDKYNLPHTSKRYSSGTEMIERYWDALVPSITPTTAPGMARSLVKLNTTSVAQIIWQSIFAFLTPKEFTGTTTVCKDWEYIQSYSAQQWRRRYRIAFMPFLRWQDSVVSIPCQSIQFHGKDWKLCCGFRYSMMANLKYHRSYCIAPKLPFVQRSTEQEDAHSAFQVQQYEPHNVSSSYAQLYLPPDGAAEAALLTAAEMSAKDHKLPLRPVSRPLLLCQDRSRVVVWDATWRVQWNTFQPLLVDGLNLMVGRDSGDQGRVTAFHHLNTPWRVPQQILRHASLLQAHFEPQLGVAVTNSRRTVCLWILRDRAAEAIHDENQPSLESQAHEEDEKERAEAHDVAAGAGADSPARVPFQRRRRRARHAGSKASSTVAAPEEEAKGEEHAGSLPPDEAGAGAVEDAASDNEASEEKNSLMTAHNTSACVEKWDTLQRPHWTITCDRHYGEIQAVQVLSCASSSLKRSVLVAQMSGYARLLDIETGMELVDVFAGDSVPEDRHLGHASFSKRYLFCTDAKSEPANSAKTTTTKPTPSRAELPTEEDRYIARVSTQDHASTANVQVFSLTRLKLSPPFSNYNVKMAAFIPNHVIKTAAQVKNTVVACELYRGCVITAYKDGSVFCRYLPSGTLHCLRPAFHVLHPQDLSMTSEGLESRYDRFDPKTTVTSEGLLLIPVCGRTNGVQFVEVFDVGMVLRLEERLLLQSQHRALTESTGRTPGITSRKRVTLALVCSVTIEGLRASSEVLSLQADGIKGLIAMSDQTRMWTWAVKKEQHLTVEAACPMVTVKSIQLRTMHGESQGAVTFTDRYLCMASRRSTVHLYNMLASGQHPMESWKLTHAKVKRPRESGASKHPLASWHGVPAPPTSMYRPSQEFSVEEKRRCDQAAHAARLRFQAVLDAMH